MWPFVSFTMTLHRTIKKEFGKIIDINAKKEETPKKEQLTADGQKVLPYITLNIIPVAKPRMTQSDKWKKRPATEKYWKYKDSFILLIQM